MTSDYHCVICGKTFQEEPAIIEEPGFFGGSYFICPDCFNSKIKPLLQKAREY